MNEEAEAYICRCPEGFHGKFALSNDVLFLLCPFCDTLSCLFSSPHPPPRRPSVRPRRQQVMGHHPFDPTGEATDEEIMESIVNSEPDFEDFDPQAEKLIRQMLSRDPASRPSARDVLQSPWLQVAAHAHVG